MVLIVGIVCTLFVSYSFFVHSYEQRDELRYELEELGGTQRLKMYPQDKEYWVLLFPDYIGAIVFLQIYSVTSQPESDLITVNLETDQGNTTVVMTHVAGEIISTTIVPPAPALHGEQQVRLNFKF